MRHATGASDLHLLLPLGVTVALGRVALVPAAVAGHPLDIARRAAALGADRHAAGAAQAVLALDQPMPHGHPFVEDEAFATPQALRLGHRLEVFEDAALQVVDVAHPLGLEEGGGLFAADAAGAVHGDLGRRRPIQQGAALGAEPVGELAEGAGVGLDRALEGADLALVIVAGVDDDGVGIGDQGVPVLGRDIGPDALDRVDAGLAHGDDLGLHPHLHAVEGHGLGGRVLQLQPVKARQGAHPVDDASDRGPWPGDGAVDPLVRHQQGAAHLSPAQLQQVQAQRRRIGHRGETVEGGHGEGRHRGNGRVDHRLPIASGSAPRDANNVEPRVTPSLLASGAEAVWIGPMVVVGSPSPRIVHARTRRA
ncbi:hypothetical protein D3C77_343660 [compost metagenome]